MNTETTTATTTYEVKATFAKSLSHHETWVCETHEEAEETVTMLSENGNWKNFRIFEVTTREMTR
jgi:hypothetical protein